MIEDGLLDEDMNTEEKAAYDACQKDVVLPEKDTEAIAYLLALDKCYNTDSGKPGWGCEGNRRACATGFCCGKLWKEGDEKDADYQC